MTGINLVGRHVSLSVSRRDQSNTVKIIIKDLPLHEISNGIMLSELKQHAKVSSDVKYCNVYVNGKRMHLQNRDRFAYVTQEEMSKIPDTLFVQGFKARIFKPPKFQTCHQCGEIGYLAKNDQCPALALEDIRASIQPFRGGQCELSNFHICPEGCTWERDGQVINSAEKDYQYGMLIHHGKQQEANEVLQMSFGFKIKKTAQVAIPKQDESWDSKDKMVKVVRCKYEACAHARTALLESRLEIAEATADKVWGMGLNVDRILECLQDFWPGQNLMG